MKGQRVSRRNGNSGGVGRLGRRDDRGGRCRRAAEHGAKVRVAGTAIGSDAAALEIGDRTRSRFDGGVHVTIGFSPADADDHFGAFSLRLSLNNGIVAERNSRVNPAKRDEGHGLITKMRGRFAGQRRGEGRVRRNRVTHPADPRTADELACESVVSLSVQCTLVPPVHRRHTHRHHTMNARTLPGGGAVPPWLRRPDWAAKIMRHAHLRDAATLLVMAAVWNAFTLMLHLLAGVPRWAVLAWGALGALLAVGALRQLFYAARHGVSELHLASVPQRLGRRFDARLVLRRRPEHPVHLSLTCARTLRGRAGAPLWSAASVVPQASAHESPEGWTVPVSFDMPESGEETLDAGTAPGVAWCLDVAIGQSKDAPEARASFLIPVFGEPAARIDGRPSGDEFEELLAEWPEEIQRKIRADIERQS